MSFVFGWSVLGVTEPRQMGYPGVGEAADVGDGADDSVQSGPVPGDGLSGGVGNVQNGFSRSVSPTLVAPSWTACSTATWSVIRKQL